MDINTQSLLLLTLRVLIIFVGCGHTERGLLLFSEQPAKHLKTSICDSLSSFYGTLPPIQGNKLPPFVIHNWGKSGSHFLTQTLHKLGLPVAFEYGLRDRDSTKSKTQKAKRMYEIGDVAGFSGANFEYGKPQPSLAGEPTDWTGIVNALLSNHAFPSSVRHIVLLRSNTALHALAKAAGLKHSSEASLAYSAKELTKLSGKVIQSIENIARKLVRTACTCSHLGTFPDPIFVVNYEDLRYRPYDTFNQILMFLGHPSYNETEILNAVAMGQFKKAHKDGLYPKAGLEDIVGNLTLLRDKHIEVDVKACILHQVLAEYPRTEQRCFARCFVPSGPYTCPALVEDPDVKSRKLLRLRALRHRD